MTLLVAMSNIRVRIRDLEALRDHAKGRRSDALAMAWETAMRELQHVLEQLEKISMEKPT